MRAKVLTSSLLAIAATGAAVPLEAHATAKPTIASLSPVSPTPVSVVLPGDLSEIEPAADGGIATVVSGETAALLRLPLGATALTPPTILVPVAPATVALPGIERDGHAVVVTVQRSSAALRTLVRDFAPDGTPAGAAQPIPGFGSTDLPADIALGPTGAVAITTDRTSDGGHHPRLAFRPAGQATFNPAIPTGRDKTRAQSLFDVIQTTRIARLGPDGGGVLLTVPGGNRQRQAPPFAQRITPQGKLGEQIRIAIGRHFTTDAKLSIGPDGTAAMVFVASDPGRVVHYQRQFPERMWATSLAPGATSVTPPQALGTNRRRNDAWDFDLTAAHSEHPAMIRWNDEGVQVFDDAAGSFTQTATLPAAFATDVWMTVSPDGSETVIGAVHGLGFGAIIESHRPVGGAFGAPRAVVSSKRASVDYEIDTPQPLPNGDVAFTYTQNAVGGPVNTLVRFRP